MKRHGFRIRYLIAAIALILAAAVILSSNSPAPTPVHSGTVPDDSETIERGKYLADAGNCISCHTTKGGVPFVGGVPFETPFGTIYSTNITPDVETGIGSWTSADFRRAMHEGIGADGSRLFPAFPYTSYTKVTDEDVAAIYAYLKSLDAVRYTPPKNSFILKQRWAVRIWNALSFEKQRFLPDDTKSGEWNRGAYLVEGLGHCSACHTPRNRIMGEIKSRAYEGGLFLHEVSDGKVRLWSAVNLTSAENGLAAWSVEDLAQYLHKGFSRRAGTFGPMNDVIINSLMKLTVEDVNAMAVYLKSLPATGFSGQTVPDDRIEAGKAIYKDRCEECHGRSGRGGIFSAPPLAGSAVVQAENPASLINIIMYGPEMPKEVSYGAWEAMRAYGNLLDDAEIAAVSNYVRGSWGNLAGPVSEGAVAQQR